MHWQAHQLRPMSSLFLLDVYWVRLAASFLSQNNWTRFSCSTSSCRLNGQCYEYITPFRLSILPHNPFFLSLSLSLSLWQVFVALSALTREKEWNTNLVVDVIKLFFGGNLDFSEIKKVCYDDWTCTKMLTQCYFKLNYIRTLLICSKMAYSCCFS